MLSRLKGLFKLNNWKRILIMVFSFISMVLFVGLSFGLYSKDSLPTTEFKNGLQVTIKTTNEDGSSVDDPFYLNQVFNNLSGRLQEKYPDKRFDLQRETNGVFNLKATDINTETVSYTHLRAHETGSGISYASFLSLIHI